MRVRGLLAIVLLAVAGCASAPTEREPGDRFERVNRVAHGFNRGVDLVLMRPVAEVYKLGAEDRLPGKIRRRVSNFVTNLRGPIDISNNFLQGEFRRSFSGVGRLLVNSTIGLGGLFDLASKWGMPRHQEDFGQTFAKWGVPQGPYVVLPLLGPSSVRDVAGLVLGWQIHAGAQYDDISTRNGLLLLDLIHTRAEQLRFERQREVALDSYVQERGLYLRSRARAIRNEDSPDAFDYQSLLDESFENVNDAQSLGGK